MVRILLYRCLSGQLLPCGSDTLLDQSASGGAGIDIGLTDAIDARLGLLYTLGLSHISDDLSGSVKHRALTIRAGLGVPIS